MCVYCRYTLFGNYLNYLFVYIITILNSCITYIYRVRYTVDTAVYPRIPSNTSVELTKHRLGTYLKHVFFF